MPTPPSPFILGEGLAWESPIAYGGAGLGRSWLRGQRVGSGTGTVSYARGPPTVLHRNPPLRSEGRARPRGRQVAHSQRPLLSAAAGQAAAPLHEVEEAHDQQEEQDADADRDDRHHATALALLPVHCAGGRHKGGEEGAVGAAHAPLPHNHPGNWGKGCRDG